MDKQECEAWLKRQWPCTVWRDLYSSHWTAAAIVRTRLHLKGVSFFGRGKSPGEAFLDLVRVISEEVDNA